MVELESGVCPVEHSFVNKSLVASDRASLLAGKWIGPILSKEGGKDSEGASVTWRMIPQRFPS